MDDLETELPSEEEFEQFFWEVFESLRLLDKNTLRNWWKNHPGSPYIFSDPDKMFAKEDSYAETAGVCFLFKWETIVDKQLSIFFLILHEIGHAFYLATGKQFISEYQENYDVYEKQADQFAKTNLKRLKNDRKSKGKILATRAFEKLRGKVNISPFD